MGNLARCANVAGGRMPGATSTDMTDPIPSVRLDLWLWAARFYKTRSLAKQAIESSKVEVAGRARSHRVPCAPVNELQVRRGDELFEIEVLALSSKRGSASVAQTLYVESEESRPRARPRAKRRRWSATAIVHPSTSPTSGRGGSFVRWAISTRSESKRPGTAQMVDLDQARLGRGDDTRIGTASLERI